MSPDSKKTTHFKKKKDKTTNNLDRKEVCDIARKAGRGALWQFMGGGWQTLIRLAASTVLARVLTPQDFGLFGMALLAKGVLGRFGALGMSTGLIAKKAVTEEDINTCFWSMAGIRSVMFLTAWVCAPLAALFFKEPRVTEVLRTVAILFLLTIVGNVPKALLRKELRFKILVIIRASSILIESISAILLAFVFNLGYWSLVIALLIGSTLEELLMFSAKPWLPKIAFSKKSFRYLFKFGFNTLLFGLFNYLNQNIDYVIVGRILGAKNLGLYEFAYRIPHMTITRIARPIGSVVFPAFSKIQDHDSLIRDGYLRIVRTIALITWPILALLAATADYVVPILWGDQWLPIITPLRILCACAAFRILFQPMGSIFNAKQRPDLPAKFSAIRLFITSILVTILGLSYELTGVALAMLLSVIPSIFFAHIGMRMTNGSVKDLIYHVKPIVWRIFISLVLLFSTKNLIDINPAWQLFILISIFLISYLILLCIPTRSCICVELVNNIKLITRTE